MEETKDSGTSQETSSYPADEVMQTEVPSPRVLIIDSVALAHIKDRAVQHFHEDPGGNDMIHRCLFRALGDYLDALGLARTFEVRL